MGANNHYKAQQFIDVIPGTGGIVTKIAAAVGCSWHTAKKYIDTYPTIGQAYDDECETVLDVAESVIIKKLTEQDEQTAKWYLAMKGTRRGYAQKQKIEHTGSGDKGQLLVSFVDSNTKPDDV